MAKRKTLFDDRPAEIQELTYIIKGDLNSLNQQIARLQEISKSQRKSTTGKHLLSHSSNMVVALQAKLANMSSDFKQVLEVRTENLKQQKNRRDQVSWQSLQLLFRDLVTQYYQIAVQPRAHLQQFTTLDNAGLNTG